MNMKSAKPEKTGMLEKKTEQGENEMVIFIKGLIVIFVPIIIMGLICLTFKWWSQWNWLLVVPYIPIAAFLVFYFYWAKHKIMGVFIEEGYCVIFAWGGKGFVGAALQYDKHYFNKDWDVEEIKTEDDEEKKPWRHRAREKISFLLRHRRILGATLYPWPFKRIYEYDMTWAKKTEKGERVSKTEKLSRVLLKPYVYSFEYQNMEDKDRMPVNVELAVEIQIINPVKALFGVEKWYRAILNLTEGYIRTFFGKYFYRELVLSQDEGSKEGGLSLRDKEDKEPPLKFKDVGEAIFYLMSRSTKRENAGEEKEEKGALGTFQEEYGVRVKKIKVMQVVPSRKEDVEATLQQMRALREQEAIQTKAQAEAFKTGQELMGSVMQALSVATGAKAEDLQKEYGASPKKFEEEHATALKEAYDFAKRRLAFIHKGRLEIVTPGGTDSGSKEGSGGGINMDRLIEVIAAIEMTKQTLSQRTERPVPEDGGKISSTNKEDAVKALKKELGYKF